MTPARWQVMSDAAHVAAVAIRRGQPEETKRLMAQLQSLLPDGIYVYEDGEHMIVLVSERYAKEKNRRMRGYRDPRPFDLTCLPCLGLAHTADFVFVEEEEGRSYRVLKSRSPDFSHGDRIPGPLADHVNIRRVRVSSFYDFHARGGTIILRANVVTP